MKIATISSKGQITLPSSLLKELQLQPKHKVIIRRAKNAIFIEPLQRSIVEETAGSLTHLVPPEKRGVSFKKIRAITQRLAAEEIMKE